MALSKELAGSEDPVLKGNAGDKGREIQIRYLGQKAGQ